MIAYTKLLSHIQGNFIKRFFKLSNYVQEKTDSQDNIAITVNIHNTHTHIKKKKKGSTGKKHHHVVHSNIRAHVCVYKCRVITQT